MSYEFEPLYTESSEPAAVPVVASPKPAGNGLQTLILCAIVAIVAIFAWERYQERSVVPDDDRQEQRDDKDFGSKTVGSITKWIVLVEETGDSSKHPHVALIKNDSAYWDSLEAKGIRFRPYDVSLDDAAPFATEAKSVGLPAVLFIDAAGNTILSKPCPQTTSSIDEILASKAPKR